jgi:homoserine dehydrogenase
MSRAPLRVGVLGAGTVGRAVIAGLLAAPDRLCAHDGVPLVLGAVAVRDLERARAAGVPADLLTDAPAHLVADPTIDVIVELMGGDEPARTLIGAALGAGKPVVTANKHVLAQHGPELEGLARANDATLRFEATVGGGTPILGPLAADLAANEVSRVRGIVNGTTNHILTAMARDGSPYEDVLRSAQEAGYAEADPRGDVEGDDAVNKLVILARLAFGAWLDPTTIGRRPPAARGEGAPGITGIDERYLRGAAALGLTIRLLATATRSPDGVAAAVIPTAVPGESPFGRTDGVTNRIEIDAAPVGSVAVVGPGAGGPATSSAVLADLVAIARGLGSTWAGAAPAGDRARPALDALGTPRPWLAVVRGGRLDSLREALGEVAAVQTTDGTAVATDALPLDRARAAIASVTDGAAVTLYPIDD